MEPLKVNYIRWKFILRPFHPFRSEIELRIECTNAPTVEFTAPIWRWQTWVLFLLQRDLDNSTIGRLEWALGTEYPE